MSPGDPALGDSFPRPVGHLGEMLEDEELLQRRSPSVQQTISRLRTTMSGFGPRRGALRVMCCSTRRATGVKVGGPRWRWACRIGAGDGAWIMSPTVRMGRRGVVGREEASRPTSLAVASQAVARPVRKATITSCARSRTASFSMMRLTCGPGTGRRRSAAYSAGSTRGSSGRRPSSAAPARTRRGPCR